MPIDAQAVIRYCWILCSPVYAILIVIMIIGICNSRPSSIVFQILVVLFLLHLVFTITVYLEWRGRRGYQELPSNRGEGAGLCEGPANASTHLNSGVPQGVEVVPPYYQPTRSSALAGAKGSDTSLDLLNPNLSI